MTQNKQDAKMEELLSNILTIKTIFAKIDKVENLNKICDKFKENLGNLVFRRAEEIEFGETARYQAWYYEDDCTRHAVTIVSNQKTGVKKIYFPDGSWDYLTPENFDRNIEEECSYFNIMTTTRQIRNNEPERIRGKPILANCRNYAEIRIDEGLFQFEECRKTEILPHCVPNPPNRVYHGDLICGILSNKGNFFEKWFICSEQFLRLWTCLMYDRHDSFKNTKNKLLEDEKEIRKWLTTGNRLCTNTLLKWTMAYVQNGLKPDPKSFKEHNVFYHRLRTEKSSRNFCMTYVALCVMLRYHEFPNKENLPKVLTEGVPNMTDWHLPLAIIEGDEEILWLQKIVRIYELKIVQAEVEIPVLENIGKYHNQLFDYWLKKNNLERPPKMDKRNKHANFDLGSYSDFPKLDILYNTIKI